MNSSSPTIARRGFVVPGEFPSMAAPTTHAANDPAGEFPTSVERSAIAVEVRGGLSPPPNDEARAVAAAPGFRGQETSSKGDCARPATEDQPAASLPAPTIDLDAARRFFGVMAPGEPLTFQTFDDSGAGRRGLTSVIHGDLGERVSDLSRLNDAGAGIFWLVNRGDGTARKAANVIAVRALFLDLDGAPLEPVLAAGAPPHAVIESSPGKWHAYWLVTGCALAEFKPLQKALAKRFGGDGKVNDLPRVLRVPGFLHRKRCPVQSRVHLLDARVPYRVFDLVHAFGLQVPTAGLASVPLNDDEAALTEERQKADRRSQKTDFCPSSAPLLSIPFWPPPECLPKVGGERNATLFRFVRYVKGVMREATLDQRRQFAERWYEMARPFIRTEDFAITFDDFERGWLQVKSPHGANMSAILSRAHDAPLPYGADVLRYGGAGNLLIRICAALHVHQRDHHGGDPLILPSRAVGEWIGVNRTDASKLLRRLVADGVLELGQRGTKTKASRYRYVWPERQPEAAPARQPGWV